MVMAAALAEVFLADLQTCSNLPKAFFVFLPSWLLILESCAGGNCLVVTGQVSNGKGQAHGPQLPCTVATNHNGRFKSVQSGISTLGTLYLDRLEHTE